MRLPESAGRWFAVLVAVPLLMTLATLLLVQPASARNVSWVLFAFATLFLVYEVLWLTGTFHK